MPAPSPADPGPRYRDLGGPARVAIAFLACTFLIEVFAIYAYLNTASVVGALLHQPLGSVALGRIAAANHLSTVAKWLGQGAVVATAVPFIVWFRGARLNAEHFDPKAMRSTRGWAIGAWCVPVGFLWLPKHIANDIHRATSGPPRQAAGKVSTCPSRRLLNTWWGLWLGTICFPVVGGFVGDFVFVARNEAGTEADLALGISQEQALVNACAAVTSMLAAVAAVLVVRRITAAQRAAQAALLAGRGAQRPVENHQEPVS